MFFKNDFLEKTEKICRVKAKENELFNMIDTYNDEELIDMIDEINRNKYDIEK